MVIMPLTEFIQLYTQDLKKLSQNRFMVPWAHHEVD